MSLTHLDSLMTSPAHYPPKTWKLRADADNIFDVYRKRLKNYKNTVKGILAYSNEASPFGY